MMELQRFLTHLAARALCLGFVLLAGAFAASGARAQQGGQTSPSRPGDSKYANPWGPSLPGSPIPFGGVAVTVEAPRASTPGLLIPAYLFKPAERSKGAVVIIGAGGGVSNNREGHYARSLSSAGYVALVIDSYGARGVTSTTENNAAVSVFDQARDAFAARKLLIDAGNSADRISVMGSGRGGTVALLAADRTFIPDADAKRFALAMAVSPGCIFHPMKPNPVASVFIAIGDRDNIVGQERCNEWVKEYASAGGKVSSKVYRGAASGFDGDPVDIRMFNFPKIETFVDCRVDVDPDGRSVYDGRSFEESQFAALVEQMRTSCIHRGGSGYTNLTQKANVTLDLIDFLDSNFPQ
jgi:dienelactone hydrolase